MRHAPAHRRPPGLAAAAKNVLRTRTEYLLAAQRYLDGHGGETGSTYEQRRAKEIAASIEMLTESGLDPQVLIVLRGDTHVTDAQAFAAVGAGCTAAEVAAWGPAQDWPPLEGLRALATLRGFPDLAGMARTA